MPPVVSGVVDGGEGGFVFAVCAGEGYLLPRHPMDGVVGVLE